MADKPEEKKTLEVSPEALNPEKLVPEKTAEKTAEETAPSTPMPAITAAPAAVKRSMPMALSICLGILLAGLASLFFYKLMWLILLLYLSFIAATVLEAPVHWMTRHGIRRGFAAVLVSLGALGIVVALLVTLSIGILNEAGGLQQKAAQMPDKIEKYVNTVRAHFITRGEDAANTTQGFNLSKTLGDSMPNLSTVWANAMIGVEIISGLVIMFFIVLYMLVDGADHLKTMRGVLPKDSRLEATKLFGDLSKAHRGWAFASVANVCSATILLSTGLWLVGVPGAILLGLIAGLGELIPNIGPFLGAMPAILLTLIVEPEKFWWVVGVFVVLQTIQSYTISPMMLRFSVELPVLVTIVSVLVFGTLFGFLGVVVAIPLVADMVVVWGYINARREKDATDYDAANTPAGGADGERAGVKVDRQGMRGMFRRNTEGAKV